MNRNRPTTEMGQEIDFEIKIDEDNADIYLRFSGFDNLEDSNEYADYLMQTIPLMLFESDVMH